MSGVQETHVLKKGGHGVRSPLDGLEGKPRQESGPSDTERDSLRFRLMRTV